MKRLGQDRTDILLVEPDRDDSRLFTEAIGDITDSTTVHVVRTGEEALDFLHQRNGYTDAPYPNLAVIDPHPFDTSDDILSTLKGTPEFRRIPVIVYTTSDAEEDVIRSYDLHANAYIQKPVDSDQFVEALSTVGEFWLSAAKLPPKSR